MSLDGGLYVAQDSRLPREQCRTRCQKQVETVQQAGVDQRSALYNVLLTIPCMYFVQQGPRVGRHHAAIVDLH